MSTQASFQAWYKSPYPWAMTVIVAAATFFIGWFMEPPNVAPPPQSLRLSGYQFINPLLACNINNSNIYQENKSLESNLKSIIDSHKVSGDISKASVYFVDLRSGSWANVYGNDMFYPSSLGKIPLAIAYYQLAENDPSVLDKEIIYPMGGVDLNQMQDIPPAQTIVPGRTYTIEQLIEYMLKYSDNNAAALLDANMDADTLARVYDDLGIPSEGNVNLANLDFMTAHQISIAFRVLYNATYLSRDHSEDLLKILGQSSFDQGITAGVSSSTIVADKLGLVGIAPNNITTEHELHDCGIVYAKDPYLLCVMTRGAGTLPT